MLMPTTFTVMVRHTASSRELSTYLGMLPARKNLTTAQGSLLSAVNICEMVFMQGITMKHRNSTTKNATQNTFTSVLPNFSAPEASSPSL